LTTRCAQRVQSKRHQAVPSRRLRTRMMSAASSSTRPQRGHPVVMRATTTPPSPTLRAYVTTARCVPSVMVVKQERPGQESRILATPRVGRYLPRPPARTATFVRRLARFTCSDRRRQPQHGAIATRPVDAAKPQTCRTSCFAPIRRWRAEVAATPPHTLQTVRNASSSSLMAYIAGMDVSAPQPLPTDLGALAV